MRAKQTLQRGLAVLRRNALVSVAVMIVVVSVGVVYVQNQMPTYQATAQLVIEKRAQVGRELPEAVSFMEDAKYSATQRYLLKHDEDLAREVLEKLARKREVERIGIGIGALLGGIRVQPLPGTLVVKVSFEGPDPRDAIEIVNAYAQAYVDKNRNERLGTVESLVAEVGALLEEAVEGERAASSALDAHRAGHGEVAFTTGENPHQSLALALSKQVAADEMRLIDLAREVSEITSTLEAHGIRIGTNGGGAAAAVTLRAENPGTVLDEVLRTEREILALPAVSRADNVRDLRAQGRNLRDRYHTLRLDLTEVHDDTREVLRRIQENEQALGAEVRLAIVRFFREVDAVRAHLSEVNARHAAASRKARETNEALALDRRLLEDHEATATEAAGLRDRLAALEKSQDSIGSFKLEHIKIFKRASSAPLIRPNRPLTYLLTAIAALFLSIGTAVLLGYLDDTIRSKEDFERQFRDRLAFIGHVPRISPKEATDPDLVTHHHPHAVASEAFRSVRTSILLSRSGRELQSLLITSASPGEGKTTVAVNLAVTMARAGERVLLVDADLRRSRIHDVLDLERSPGLTSVLAGGARLPEAVRNVRLDGSDGVSFDVLTSGEIPPNPAELLGSPEMATLLEEARGRYGKVVLDTPPLVAVTDACVLSNRVDGVFTVISVGKTSWRLIRSGLEDLEKVDAPIRGAILNSLSAGGSGYGYYDSYRYRGYRYGGGESTKKPKRTAS